MRRIYCSAVLAVVCAAGLIGFVTAQPAADTIRDSLNLKYGVAGPPGHGLNHYYFYVNHNDTWRIPYWVAYHLSRRNLSGTARRKDDYHEDESLEPDTARSLPKDYAGTGFDKGHLAPAEDFTRSKKAMATSFLMSNMSPQYHATNGGVWAKLEAAVRAMVADEGEAWIVSGNAFVTADSHPRKPGSWIRKGGKNRVAVPTHLFKALLARDREGRWTEYAFLIPNKRVSPGKPPRDYLITVDRLEKVTGWDFFPLLDDSLENSLESQKPAVWPW
jgi:endonuclease G